MTAPRGGCLVLLLFAVPCLGSSSVESVFQKITEIRLKQTNQDAATIDALEQQIAALGRRLVSQGFQVSSGLAQKMLDRTLPVKTRLWALVWASQTKDPEILEALRSVLESKDEPELLRAEAAAAIAALPISALARRRALCPAASDASLTPLALREVLLALSVLGCEETGGLEGLVRSLGTEPKDAGAAANGLAAVGRSLAVESPAALLRLAAFYPADSPLRARALEALWEGRERLRLEASWRGDLRELAEKSGRNPAATAAALRLLAFLKEPESTPLLMRFLDSPEPENVAAAAEALAALRAPGARAKIERLVANIHRDPRFSPRAQRPDPRVWVLRLEAALKKLPQDDTVKR